MFAIMTSNVYFSDIKSHIISHLNSAGQTLKIAVSWLTDRELFGILMEKLSKGVQVSVVTRNDFLNNHPEALPWNDFIQAGGKLYFSRDGEQLHYKFVLADDMAVLCTSYNLTCFAIGNNRENVMVFTEGEFVGQFVNEFSYLTNTLNAQTHVERIRIEDTPAHLHGFNLATVENDMAKQPVTVA